MDLEILADKIRKKMEAAPKIEAIVVFDFGDDGQVTYDGTADPATAAPGTASGEAKVTFRCALSTFEGFINGTKDPNVAYLMGQLKIEGSLGLAMKLKDRLED